MEFKINHVHLKSPEPQKKTVDWYVKHVGRKNSVEG